MAVATPEGLAASVIDLGTYKEHLTDPKLKAWAERGRKKISEGDAKKLLENWKNSKNLPPVEDERLDNVVETNIKDPSLQAKANEKKEFVKRFKNQGFDGLNPEQKDVAREIITRALLKAPGMKALFDRIDPNYRNAAILAAVERIIQDDKYLIAFNEDLSKVAADATILNQAIDEAKTAYETEEIKKNQAERAFEIANEAYKKANKDLENFQKIVVAGGLTQKAELDSLNSQRQTLEDMKTNLEGQLQTALAAIQSMRESGAPTQFLKLEPLNKQLQEIKAKLERRQYLETELSTLTQEQSRTKTGKDTAEDNKKMVEKQFDLVSKRYAQAKLLRLNQENDFLAKLDSTFYRTTNDYLQLEYEEADRHQNQILEDLKKTAKDDVDKRIYDAIISRWDERTIRQGFWKRKIRGLNKKQVKKDYKNLLEFGPQSIIREMLFDSGLSMAEIDAKLAEDPTVIDRLQSDVVKRLIARKLLMGKIKEKDARKIIDTKWGKEIISQAYEENSSVQRELKVLKDKGLMEDENFLDWLTKRSNKDILKALALLLGGAVAAKVGGPLLYASALGAIKSTGLISGGAAIPSVSPIPYPTSPEIIPESAATSIGDLPELGKKFIEDTAAGLSKTVSSNTPPAVKSAAESIIDAAKKTIPNP